MSWKFNIGDRVRDTHSRRPLIGTVTNVPQFVGQKGRRLDPGMLRIKIDGKSNPETYSEVGWEKLEETK